MTNSAGQQTFSGTYPKRLRDQIRFLKENKEFFLTFGPITEPYEDKIVAKIANELKERIWDVPLAIRKYFTHVKVDVRYYFSVKFMEDHKVHGGCSEIAFLTAAIYRKMGYPAAIVDTLGVDSVFQDPKENKPMVEHSVNLVYIDGKWWLIDATKAIFSRFITTTLLNKGFIIGAIYRDPYDIGVRNRVEKYANLLYNLKDILLMDIQNDLLNMDTMRALRIMIPDNKEIAEEFKDFMKEIHF